MRSAHRDPLASSIEHALLAGHAHAHLSRSLFTRRSSAHAASRRTASESTSRETPLNNMLMPRRMPITHAALDGHVLQIMTASTTVTIP